jgi:hypothetical protein
VRQCGSQGIEGINSLLFILLVSFLSQVLWNLFSESVELIDVTGTGLLFILLVPFLSQVLWNLFSESVELIDVTGTGLKLKKAADSSF